MRTGGAGIGGIGGTGTVGITGTLGSAMLGLLGASSPCPWISVSMALILDLSSNCSKMRMLISFVAVASVICFCEANSLQTATSGSAMMRWRKMFASKTLGDY